jgi:hypothetical protein
MTASQPGFFNLQALDNLGALGVGMRLYTYAQGTTTQKTAYTGPTGAVAHTYTSDGAGGQYIALDARGELPAPLYLTAGAYDITLKTSAGATVWTRRAEPQESQTVSVTDSAYGATGDGVTDDSAAIQAAVDAHQSVYFPPGNYLCASIITLRDGSVLRGAGIAATRIIKSANNGASQGVLYANSGSSSAFIDDVYISDMEVDGLVSSLAFSEFRHLISLNGVKDCVVERVRFSGFRGDGLYIGSGIVGGDERHNVNVTVRDCVFDGVNSDNRNGITVIDCDGLMIENNTFRNCTKSTMPGPIDIEPDGNAFTILRDIVVRGNTIESFGGSTGLAVSIPVALTTTLNTVLIEGNFIKGATKANALGIYILTAEAISSAIKPMGISIIGNTVDDTGAVAMTPFKAVKVRGLIVENNTFRNGTVAELGDVTSTSVTLMGALIRGNHFNKNGNTQGALQVGTVDTLDISNNLFQEPNAGTSTIGIRFLGSGVTTTSIRVKVRDNTFIKGASQTHSVNVSGHTLDTATNTEYGNRVSGGSLTNSFTAVYGQGEYYATSTFTPVLKDAAAGTAATAASSSGRCTRIGNRVFFDIALTDINTTGLTGGNQIFVTGLPFTAANVTPIAHCIVGRSNVASTTGATYGAVIPNTAHITLSNGTTAGGASLLVSAITSTSGDLYISGSYEV